MPPTAVLVRAAEALEQLKREAPDIGAPTGPAGVTLLPEEPAPG